MIKYNFIKKMRRLATTIIALSAVSLLLFSCSDDETSSDPVTLTVSKKSCSINTKAQTINLHVISNYVWTVTNKSAWCKPSFTTSTGDYNTSLDIVCDENTEKVNRSDTLVFSVGETMRKCVITQAGVASAVWINENEVAVPKLSLTFDVTMDRGTKYDITCSDWLSVDTTKASDGIYKVTSSGNHFSQNREGNLTFSASGTIKRDIKVKQEGSFEDLSATEMAAKYVAGWNLGNTLESIGTWLTTDDPKAWETAWGNPETTKAIFKMVKAEGFNAVRIPCAWYTHADPTTCIINEKWMARVKEVVEMALSEDLIVILNCHWDNGWLDNNVNAESMSKIKDIQYKLWSQIAKTMEPYDEYLLFAGMNEPPASDVGQVAVLRSYSQSFVDAVRANGTNNAKRCLVVQAPNTDTQKAVKFPDFIPTDAAKNKLMVEIHYYAPYNFCLLGKDDGTNLVAYFWGSTYHTDAVDGVNRNCTYGEETFVDQQMAAMKTTFVNKGYPVIMGEYGCAKRTIKDAALQKRHDESRQYWYKYITSVAKKNGVLPFLWDSGNILNRKTLETPYDPYCILGIQQGSAEQLPY